MNTFILILQLIASTIALSLAIYHGQRQRFGYMFAFSFLTIAGVAVAILKFKP